MSLFKNKNSASDFNITLVGNPNVGKSTVFNMLTGLHQHTGNWPGKTVQYASGAFNYKGKNYFITDLPGTYSFTPASEDERIAGEYIKEHTDNCTVIVCDATALERSLILALQTMEICKKTIICVNLMDEAMRKGIALNLNLLQNRLGVPVVGTSINDKKSKYKLLEAIEKISENKKEQEKSELKKDTFYYVEKAEEICHGVVTLISYDPYQKDRKIDSVLLGKYTALPCMLIMLAVLFYITLSLSSYPSEFLSDLFDKGLLFLRESRFFNALPPTLSQLIIDGMLTVLAWVIAVMLPPMAIFFPLFSLLEDLGYLPRAAFLLDNSFKKCGTCGKQALTMCMGLGCNCAGISGCRIIQSRRERLTAIITNTFTPCNGRFPTLIAVITMFFISGSGIFGGKITASAIFVLLLILSVLMTFSVSKILSITLLKGEPSSFAMELPPYRKPKVGRLIVRSVLDRTIFVLARAAAVAAPAGIIIWLLSHITVGDKSIFLHITDFLDPVGKIMGLDGTILTGFILGIPANEIVMPIIMMGYTAHDTLSNYETLDSLKTLLTDNGWTAATAASMLLFNLFHWPCSTAILTIKKETANLKWTAASVIIPTIAGVITCCIFNFAVKILC